MKLAVNAHINGSRYQIRLTDSFPKILVHCLRERRFRNHETGDLPSYRLSIFNTTEYQEVIESALVEIKTFPIQVCVLVARSHDRQVFFRRLQALCGIIRECNENSKKTYQAHKIFFPIEFRRISHILPFLN